MQLSVGGDLQVAQERGRAYDPVQILIMDICDDMADPTHMMLRSFGMSDMSIVVPAKKVKTRGARMPLKCSV